MYSLSHEGKKEIIEMNDLKHKNQFSTVSGIDSDVEEDNDEDDQLRPEERMR